MADPITGNIVAPVTEPVTAPLAGGEKPWYDGADAETIGYFQNRGLDTKTAVEAAIAASKGHREAQAFIGVPPDKLLKLADPTDEAGYKAMWGRLGAGDAPDKYDLSGAKLASGETLKPTTLTALQAAFADNHVPVNAALAVAQALAKVADSEGASNADTALAATEAAKAALSKEWGQNYDPNMAVARAAAAKLGVSPESVAALEKVSGFDGVMKMFLKIGESMGEAAFIKSPYNPEIIVNTREKAMARKAELMADKAWVQRYQEGGTSSKEFRELQYLISQEMAGGDDIF